MEQVLAKAEQEEAEKLQRIMVHKDTRHIPGPSVGISHFSRLFKRMDYIPYE